MLVFFRSEIPMVLTCYENPKEIHRVFNHLSKGRKGIFSLGLISFTIPIISLCPKRGLIFTPKIIAEIREVWAKTNYNMGIVMY